MSDEDQIKWLTLKIDLTPEAETKLEVRAQAQGLSLK